MSQHDKIQLLGAVTLFVGVGIGFALGFFYPQIRRIIEAHFADQSTEIERKVDRAQERLDKDIERITDRTTRLMELIVKRDSS